MPPGEFNSSLLIKCELISQMVFVLSCGNPLLRRSFPIKSPIWTASYFLCSPAGHSCHISYLQLQVTMSLQLYPQGLLSIEESHCFITGGGVSVLINTKQSIETEEPCRNVFRSNLSTTLLEERYWLFSNKKHNLPLLVMGFYWPPRSMFK